MKPLILLTLLTAAVPLFGQAEIRGSIGVNSFADDGIQKHLLLSGGARYYFYKNLGVEGEYQYMRQNRNHQDHVFLPLIVWDARSKGRVIPYFLAGAGVMRTVQKYDNVPAPYPNSLSYTRTFGQGGFGVKIFLSEHWYVAPEIRAGWEWHARVSGTVGYSWKKR